MKLEIDPSLVQRLLEHLATNPTGGASWKEVNDLIQALATLKPPAPPAPKQPKKTRSPS